MTKEKFREHRKRMGLSQAKLGDQIGRTKMQIIRYEMGQAEIPMIAELALEALMARHEAAS